jgi:hypothetical protein
VISVIMKKYFFVDSSGEVQGPTPLAELRSMHQTGQLPLNTQVCEEGGQAWEALHAVYSPSNQAIKIPSKSSLPDTKNRNAIKSESEATKILNWNLSFSLHISKRELIFHFYCRLIGFISVCFAVIFGGLFVFDDDHLGYSWGVGWGIFAGFMSYAFVHLGIAQIIRLFHSIAYNIQAIKENAE